MKYLVAIQSRDGALQGACWIKDPCDPGLVVVSAKPCLLAARDAQEVYILANRMMAGRIRLLSSRLARKRIPSENWT
jgi:hypothetical protein